MLTVVLDTNVLIDARNDEYSYTRRIVDLVVEGKVKAVASHSTQQENKRIVGRVVNDEEWQEELQQFFDALQYVRAQFSTGRGDLIPDDPEDEKFLYLAAEYGADFIVSADRHLLDVEEYEGVRIVTPQDFWYAYKEEGGDGGGEWQDWMRGIISSNR